MFEVLLDKLSDKVYPRALIMDLKAAFCGMHAFTLLMHRPV